MVHSWPGVVNRVLLPALALIAGVLLVLLGDGEARTLGVALLGFGAGIPLPQRATGPWLKS